MCWRAHRELLLRLYTALVLFKIDYGYVVSSSARRSCLKKLDPVYSSGVRYATEAFRTSPAQRLYCEAGMTSLHLRRQLLLLRYVAEILVLSSHIHHVLLANHRLSRIYDRRSTSTRPAPQNPTADGPSSRSNQIASSMSLVEAQNRATQLN